MKTPLGIISSSGAILATLAAFCWGIGTVMSKDVLDSFSPIFLLALQLAASVVFLWGLIFLRRIPAPTVSRMMFVKVASLGLLEPWLAYFLGLIGLAVTRASNATLIQATEAIMIIIVSAILFRVKTTLRFVALSVVAVGGLLVTLGVFTDGGNDGGSLFGDALVFAGTAAAAVYVVLSGRFATSMHPLYIVAWQQTIALIFAGLLLPFERAMYPQTQAIATIPPDVWLWAAASGLVQYAFAFSLYIAALRTITANYAGSFLNLTPVFGLAAAFLFLHETLSWLQLIGAAVTVIAVASINLNAGNTSKA